jgi:hypothetical protein
MSVPALDYRETLQRWTALAGDDTTKSAAASLRTGAGHLKSVSAPAP